MRWFFFLLFFSFLGIQTGFAAPSLVLLGEDDSSLYLGASAMVRMQAQGALDLAQPGPAEEYRLLGEDHPNFSLETRAVWLWNLLQSRADQPLHWVLSTGFSNNRCHLLKGNAAGQLQQVPLWQPGHWSNLYRFDLQPGEQVQLFVGCQTQHAALNPDMILYSEKAFWQQEILYRVFQGVYFGVILIMIGYNFFLFASLKDPTYFFYVLTLAAAAFFQFVVDGLAMETILNPDYNNRIALLSMPVVGLAVTAFTRSLLEVQRKHPKLDQLLLAIMWLCAGLTLVSPWMSLGLLSLLSPLLSLVFPSCLIWVGMLEVATGSKVARYYLLSWTAYLFAVLGFTLYYLGFDPSHFSYQQHIYVLKAGVLVEVMLLSLALAERYNQYREQALEANTQMALSAKRHAFELETKVAERTKQLKEANDSKDQFFSILAHDLRGPIGSLAAGFRALRRGEMEPTPELLRVFGDSAAIVEQQLEELLTWSRSQRGTLKPKIRAFWFSELVKPVVQMLQPQAKKKGVALELTQMARMMVKSDLSMAATILRNLLSNAIKFTPRGGKITIEVDRWENELWIGVRDPGIGMDEKRQAALFRIHEVTPSQPGTEDESGTGLGLVLCKEFSEKLQGDIGVESKKGEGSLFWFTLPLVSHSDHPSDLHKKSAVLHGLRVLLAEDLEMSRLFTMHRLRRAGAECVSVTDGVEAVQKIRQQQFDLFLTDLAMPAMSGAQAAQIIQQELPERPWIIAITALEPHEISETIGTVRFDGILKKPLEGPELEEMIESLSSANRGAS